MYFNRSLLPLAGLKAFEATARRRSFEKAAEEIRLQPAAVRRQVARLEELLGAQLLRAGEREVALTEAGERLFSSVMAGFNGMLRTMRDVAEVERRDVLRIAMSPAFAHAFGQAADVAFRAEHADIGVALESSEPCAERAEEYDFAVILSQPVVSTKLHDLLMAEEVTPLCAPELAATGGGPAAFLAQRPLIQAQNSDCARASWRRWALRAGAPEAVVDEGEVIKTPGAGLCLALEGRGVLIADPRLYRRELASGRLVAPFVEQCRTGCGFYLVSRAEDLAHEPNRLFRQWMIEQCARELAAHTADVR
ncbi:MAG: LysR substrate-binding domain-containing protein [Neomegalonema sp.]|nr:LysR substrate-binding domain-containing protein [Neomegalonema sp.]